MVSQVNGFEEKILSRPNSTDDAASTGLRKMQLQVQALERESFTNTVAAKELYRLQECLAAQKEIDTQHSAAIDAVHTRLENIERQLADAMAKQTDFAQVNHERLAAQKETDVEHSVAIDALHARLECMETQFAEDVAKHMDSARVIQECLAAQREIDVEHTVSIDALHARLENTERKFAEDVAKHMGSARFIQEEGAGDIHSAALDHLSVRLGDLQRQFTEAMAALMDATETPHVNGQHQRLDGLVERVVDAHVPALEALRNELKETRERDRQELDVEMAELNQRLQLVHEAANIEQLSEKVDRIVLHIASGKTAFDHVDQLNIGRAAISARAIPPLVKELTNLAKRFEQFDDAMSDAMNLADRVSKLEGLVMP